MRNYWVTYLSPAAKTADSRIDPTCGQYRHRALLQADSPRGIVAELRARGATTLSIKPARAPSPLLDRSMSRQAKVDLLRAIALNMSGGISAGRAYELAAAAATGPMRVRLDSGLQVLARGGSFADAIASLGLYDETTQILLEAGERTGDVRQAIDAAIAHYTAHAANMKGLIALAGVVGVDLLMAIPSVWAVRYEMLPMLANTSMPQAKPEQVQAFKTGLANATLLNDVLLWLAGLLVLALLAGGVCLTDPAARAWLMGHLQRVPVLGRGLRDSALSASTKALSHLLRGGVTLVRALDIVRAGVRHPGVSRYYADVQQRLDAGDTVAQAMRHEAMEPAEQMLMAAHQDQRQLADVLGQIATRRADAAAAAYKLVGKISIGVSIAYTLASAAAGIYVYTIQSAAMTAGL